MTVLDLIDALRRRRGTSWAALEPVALTTVGFGTRLFGKVARPPGIRIGAREATGSDSMIVRIALGLFVFTAAALGCQNSMASGTSSSLRVLGEADSGKQVTLAVGATFEVRLRGSPGTGYLWELTAGDQSIVAPHGEPRGEPIGEVRPGSSTMQVITFVGRSPGKTRLELGYLRPWEREKGPVKTFVVEVEVTAK